MRPVPSNPWPGRAAPRRDYSGLSTAGVALPWVELDEQDISQIIRDLKGRPCTLKRRQREWIIVLSDGRKVETSVPWRMVGSNRILLGSVDEGRLYGLHDPVDCTHEAEAMLDAKIVDHVAICDHTADLTLLLSDGIRIDLFNHSSGIDGWHLRCRIRETWATVIGSGGGHIRASLDAPGYRPFNTYGRDRSPL